MTIGWPAGDETEGRVKKYQRYKRFSHAALGFLLVGFSLQIASNHLPAAPNPGNVPTYASAPIFSPHWVQPLARQILSAVKFGAFSRLAGYLAGGGEGIRTLGRHLPPTV